MILIGTDNGIYRWAEGSGWPVYHSLQDRSIAHLASPGGGVLIAVDTGGRVFESVNNGFDWRSIPLPAGAGRATALACRGETMPRIVVAARPLSIYSRAVGEPVPKARVDTGTGALSFVHRARSIARGATALIAPESRRRVATDPKTVALAGWTQLPVPAITSAPGGPAPEVRAFAIGTREPSPWYAAVSGAGLWRSLDGGVGWERCPGLPPAEVFAIRVPDERPASVYAASSDGCWYSTDAGLTWEDRSGGLEKARHVRALAVKPGAPDVLLAGAAPQAAAESNAAPRDGLGFSLYESSNGGKTWSQVKRGGPEVFEYDVIADIRHDPVAPENAIVALSSGELWATRNGGFFWTPLARQIHAARTLCPMA